MMPQSGRQRLWRSSHRPPGLRGRSGKHPDDPPVDAHSSTLNPPITLDPEPDMTRLAPFALLPLVFFSACSTVAAPVALFKPLGTRQCESGGPAPEAVAQVLRDAGVAVAAVACGHDGRMRPAVCGAADGRLVIVDVPVDQQARAEALGWRPLASLPDAVRRPC